jgi:ABC-type multidrug transport system fused ATPase/permease subunit
VSLYVLALSAAWACALWVERSSASLGDVKSGSWLWMTSCAFAAAAVVFLLHEARNVPLRLAGPDLDGELRSEIFMRLCRLTIADGSVSIRVAARYARRMRLQPCIALDLLMAAGADFPAALVFLSSAVWSGSAMLLLPLALAVAAAWAVRLHLPQVHNAWVRLAAVGVAGLPAILAAGLASGVDGRALLLSTVQATVSLWLLLTIVSKVHAGQELSRSVRAAGTATKEMVMMTRATLRTPLRGQILLRDLRLLDVHRHFTLLIDELRIAPAERVAIVGPAGAGKSVLLKLISGRCKPRAGSIAIDGLSHEQLSAAGGLRRFVGVLPEADVLHPGTLRDNLLDGLPDPGDDILLSLCRDLSLQDLVQRHPQGLDQPLSPGMDGLRPTEARRIALGRAIVGRPRLCLLDDPTRGLPYADRERIVWVLGKWLPSDGTLVVVTTCRHLFSQVDRVILLVNGVVARDGAPTDVLNEIFDNESGPQGWAATTRPVDTTTWESTVPA